MKDSDTGLYENHSNDIEGLVFRERREVSCRGERSHMAGSAVCVFKIGFCSDEGRYGIG